MPTTSQLKAKALRLIEQGAAAWRRQSVPAAKGAKPADGQAVVLAARRRPLGGDQYWTIFEKAIDLLLKHGYEKKLDPTRLLNWIYD